MKCSSVTKKLISAKVTEVTIVFLQNIGFSPKLLTMLCKSMNEKNVQLRQLCCTYVQTILSTYGSQESTRAAIGKSETSFSIVNFLKKELVDASPAVRDACRSLYWTYSQYWPEKAKKVYNTLDLPTQKALARSKPTSYISSVTSPTRLVKTAASPVRLVKTPSLKRTVSEKSPVLKNTSVPSSSRVVPGKNLPSSSSLPSYSRPAAVPKSTLARSNSSPVKPKPVPTLSKQLKQRPAATATVKPAVTAKTTSTTLKATSTAISPSIAAAKVNTASRNHPATPTTTSSTTATLPTSNKPVLSYRSAPSQRKEDLEAMSLLNMLQDDSSHTKSKGIRILAERIKDVPFEPMSAATLPDNVPQKIDILPLLMDLVARTEFDSEIHQTLMCWECITSIFTSVFSLRHYGPTLIIADQQRKHGCNADKRMKVWKTYSKGLRRLKMFLKRNDTLLAERLLSILQSAKSRDQTLLDASVKCDLKLNPSLQSRLEVGVLKWMNELLQDYIGLPAEEDHDLLEEGSDWLSPSDGNIAEQWFDTAANVQSYISLVVDMLFETNEDDNDKYPLLCSMVRNMKIANQKVFEKKLGQLDEKQKIAVEAALIVDSRSLSRDNELSVLSEDDFSVPCEVENVPPVSRRKRKTPAEVDEEDVGEPQQKVVKNSGDAVNTVSPVQKRKAGSMAQEPAFFNKRTKKCA
ncbi:clasp N terminal-domain-containing protein [Helicostylum pulchrum]|nr:clasp N terminal-domain-containing protein [Helicostylum pulchrum]